MEKDTIRDRIRGSLIGGAIGDALGYPVEFIYSYAGIQLGMAAMASRALTQVNGGLMRTTAMEKL